jgi:tetratricopeptide (TPR) repeat protein
MYAPPSQPPYGYPSQPLYGPLSQPYYGAPPSTPLVGTPPTVPLPRREPFDARRFLVDGIPLWAGIVMVVAVVVTFGVGVFALNKDWADSAWVAAFVAMTGAGVILAAGIAFLSLRRFQWLTLGLSALLLVALTASGVFALTSQAAIHRLQARSLENGKQWQASIHEYELAGEQTPNAPNIARAHLEWGEQLLQQKNYRDAIDQFYKAHQDQATSVTVDSRSLSDLYTAYKAWFATRAADVPFSDAAHFFERYLNHPACLAICKLEARELASQAYYEDGAAFLRLGACTGALNDYQHVVDLYPDTLSAQKASVALSAPVTYIAIIEAFPAHAATPAYLSRTALPSRYSSGYFSDDYSALVDSAGAATFHNIPPGSYNFSIVLTGARWYWDGANHSNILSAKAAPLCGNTQYYGWI